jgi:hypothetical protein
MGFPTKIQDISVCSSEVLNIALFKEICHESINFFEDIDF